MKRVTVDATWHTSQVVEVPDDYEWDGSSLDDEWVEQIDTGGASLTDWEVRG